MVRAVQPQSNSSSSAVPVGTAATGVTATTSAPSPAAAAATTAMVAVRRPLVLPQPSRQDWWSPGPASSSGPALDRRNTRPSWHSTSPARRNNFMPLKLPRHKPMPRPKHRRSTFRHRHRHRLLVLLVRFRTMAGRHSRHLHHRYRCFVLGSAVPGVHLQHPDAEPAAAERVALRFRCYLSHGL
jgi:hypothetical protein